MRVLIRGASESNWSGSRMRLTWQEGAPSHYSGKYKYDRNSIVDDEDEGKLAIPVKDNRWLTIDTQRDFPWWKSIEIQLDAYMDQDSKYVANNSYGYRNKSRLLWFKQTSIPTGSVTRCVMEIEVSTSVDKSPILTWQTLDWLQQTKLIFTCNHFVEHE